MWHPDHTYLVCATPRSGSTLLCETLRETGVAGRPLEHFEVFRHSAQPRQPLEYFDAIDDPEVAALLAPLDPPRRDPEPSADWWARILRDGTTPNGVWGGKLMWGHVPDLLDRAGDLPGLADPDLDRVLDALLGPDLRLVHVTRGDKVAQAVSLWRAVQTQVWRAGRRRPAAEAQYSFRGIDHLVHQLEDHDAAWRGWFADTGREAHRVTYEALAADPQRVILDVMTAVGIERVPIGGAATERQGDARADDWAVRYRAERVSAGAAT